MTSGKGISQPGSNCWLWINSPVKTEARANTPAMQKVRRLFVLDFIMRKLLAVRVENSTRERLLRKRAKLIAMAF